jgi:hypothetical protein
MAILGGSSVIVNPRETGAFHPVLALAGSALGTGARASANGELLAAIARRHTTLSTLREGPVSGVKDAAERTAIFRRRAGDRADPLQILGVSCSGGGWRSIVHTKTPAAK